MNQCTTCASTEGGRELEEIYARLREVGGDVLAQGQTPCCYALPGNHHPLLWALRKVLAIIPQGLARWRAASIRVRLTVEETTL